MCRSLPQFFNRADLAWVLKKRFGTCCWWKQQQQKLRFHLSDWEWLEKFVFLSAPRFEEKGLRRRDWQTFHFKLEILNLRVTVSYFEWFANNSFEEKTENHWPSKQEETNAAGKTFYHYRHQLRGDKSHLKGFFPEINDESLKRSIPSFEMKWNFLSRKLRESTSVCTRKTKNRHSNYTTHKLFKFLLNDDDRPG